MVNTNKIKQNNIKYIYLQNRVIIVVNSVIGLCAGQFVKFAYSISSPNPKIAISSM